MPNRLIKDSICTSESVDKLTAFQETVFYRLIVNCDDYGRMDARPDILASKLFPLRRNMPTKKIKDAVQALSETEIITLYEVGGKPYLQMRTWNKHQQIRAKKSKYPAPEAQKTTTDSTCNQMITDSSKCPRNPIQSESNPNPNPIRTRNARTRAREEADQPDPNPDRWEEFWNAYPRKSGGDIREACMEYLAVIDNGVDPETLISAAKALADRTDSETFRYLPSAEKWLRNKGWTEKVSAEKPKERRVTTFMDV